MTVARKYAAPPELEDFVNHAFYKDIAPDGATSRYLFSRGAGGESPPLVVGFVDPG